MFDIILIDERSLQTNTQIWIEFLSFLQSNKFYYYNVIRLETTNHKHIKKKLEFFNDAEYNRYIECIESTKYALISMSIKVETWKAGFKNISLLGG